MPLWIISAEWKYWGNLLHPADWCVRTDACCNCLHWFPRLLRYATRTRLQRHRTTQNYRLRTIEGQQQNNKIGIIVKKQKSFFFSGNVLIRNRLSRSRKQSKQHKPSSHHVPLCRASPCSLWSAINHYLGPIRDYWVERLSLDSLETPL